MATRCALVGLVVWLMPASVSALQPLAVFLERAQSRNPKNLEASAQSRQRVAEAKAARGALLPSLELKGTYTHNQYDAVSSFPNGDGTQRRLVFTPKNQVDGYATLEVPLVDVGGVYRYRAGKASAEAARENRSYTLLDVQRRVVKVYYELLGAEAVKQSATENLRLAESNAQTVGARKAQGSASDFDYQRAIVNQESSRQSLSEGDLLVSLKQRELEDLTGLTPDPVQQFPEDDLHQEKPLAAWLATPKEDLPQSRIALAQARAAEQIRKAAKATWLPVLSVAAQERLTNATGFIDKISYYALLANLTWRADASVAATAEAQRAAADAALAQATQAQLDAGYAVYEAWHRVRTSIDKSRAARAQVTAAARTSELATQQYENGVATQLEVVQAQRDAFEAHVARIRADIDLLYSRQLLRLATGETLVRP